MKAALFDLDGTLVNSLADIAWAMNEALEHFGLDGFEEEKYRYLVGNGVYVLTRRAVGSHHELEDRVRIRYMENYASHSLVRTRPYPGVAETLESMKKQGKKLCVFSNKPDADTRHIVESLFGPDLFDAVQGQKNGVPVKPDPAGACMLAKALGVAPEDMLYAGDSGVDMQCAVRAHMQACGVLWGFREETELRENGARFLIRNPEELEKVINL